ncbi:MAG: sugar transferase [Minisyncoccia bacterium]
MFQSSVLTPLKKALLLLFDVGIFLVAIWLALVVRSFSSVGYEVYVNHVIAFIPVLILTLGAFFASNLYEDDLFILRQKTIYRISISFIFIALGAITLFYTYPYQGVTPKSILFLFFVFAFVGTVFIRYFIAPLFLRTHTLRAFLIATGPESDDVYVQVNKYAHIPIEFSDLVPLSTSVEYLKLHKKDRFECIVVNTKRHLGEELQELLFEKVKQGTLIIDEAHLYEMIFRKVELSDANYRSFFEPLASSKKIFLVWKRLVDIFVSIPLAIPSIVLVFFAAICIKLEDRGPIFISQSRLGKFGKRITLWKMRTMTQSDAGKWLHDADNQNKVTKVGYFLRKSRIDELPQLWSIFKGELSLIGPRPDQEGFVALLEQAIPYYNLRYTVTPGLSGWAQINQDKPPQSIEETRERLAYDLYYIKYRSIGLDLYIGFKTIKTLLSRTGM